MVVGLDEDRAHPGPVAHDALVVPEEVPAGEGRLQPVEDPRDAPLRGAGRVPVREGHQPGGGGQRGGVAGRQEAQVVVGDGDGPAAVDGQRRGERRCLRGLVDALRRRPGASAVGGVHQLDRVVAPAGDVRALVGDVQLAGARVDGRARQAASGAQRLRGVTGGVGVDLGNGGVGGDLDRRRPGAALVGGGDDREVRVGDRVGGGVVVGDPGEEVEQPAGARVGDDHVADGLGVRHHGGVHEGAGHRPGAAVVVGDGEIGGAGEVRGGAGGDLVQAVPDLVGDAGVQRVGGDGVLVVADGRIVVVDQRDGVLPGAPAVVGGGGGDAVAGVGGVEDQAAGVGGAVRAEAHPAVRGALVGQAARGAVGERQRGLGEVPAVRGGGGGQAAGPAVGPAVLLEDADDVARVTWVGRQIRFVLRGRVVGARAVAADRAGGVRVTGRDQADRLSGGTGRRGAAGGAQDEQGRRERGGRRTGSRTHGGSP